MPSRPYSLTFDLEAIHDPELGVFTPKPGRDPFAPSPYWQIVCIGALLTDPSGAVTALDIVEGTTERQILETFIHTVDEHRPRLISFNGRGFDLPVIAARCRRHGLAFPMRTSKSVAFRYSTDGHYDVADYLGDYGASRRAALDVEARLIGMPGKLGVDGGSVAEMVAAGRLAEVQSYCLADVVQTHAVGLRARLEGGMPREQYLAQMSELIAAIDWEPRLAGLAGAMNRARLVLTEHVNSGAACAAAAE